MKLRKTVSILVTLSMIISCFTFLSISGGAEAGDDFSYTVSLTSATLDADSEVPANKVGAYAVHNIGVANSGGRCFVPVTGIYTEQYNLDPDGATTNNGKTITCGIQPEGTKLNGVSSRIVYNPYVCYKFNSDSGYAIDDMTLDLGYILMPYNHLYYQIGVYVDNSFDSNVSSDGAYDFSSSILAGVISGNDRAVDTGNVDTRSNPDSLSLTSAIAQLSDPTEVYVIIVLLRGYNDVTRTRLHSLTFSATQKEYAAPAGSKITINAGIANATPTADLTGSMAPGDVKAYYVHNCVVTPRANGQANIITPSLGHTPQIMTGSYDLNPNKSYEGGEHVHYGALKEGSKIVGRNNASITVQNPYVCYKLQGDAGYVIDSLSVEIGAFLRMGSLESSSADAAYYQVGIWVTDDFTIDENGIFDFSAIPYSHLISSGTSSNFDTRTTPSTVDLSEAVQSLNSNCVYVIFLLNRGYGQNDATRIGVGTLKLTATQAEAPAPAVPANVIVSYSDELDDGKIDDLYINATISKSATYDVGIIFSDSAESCKFASDGGNPLFARVAQEGHGRATAFMQSGCYGGSIITASNLGGDWGNDDVIAVYWKDLPTDIGYGTLYVCAFAKTAGVTYYGEVVTVELRECENFHPLGDL